MTTAIEIKERPILFSGEMVRAILDGRKTQTRRVLKLDKAYHECGRHEIAEWRNQNDRWFGLYEWNTVASLQCPYGQPGDRLWVRETCWSDGQLVYYVADNNAKSFNDDSEEHYQRMLTLHHYNGGFGNRVPSIHMPRWASRITLEITGLRVERLNDISEEDAISEGTENRSDLAWGHGGQGDDMARWAVDHGHRYGFLHLWESINGAGSWEQNPWVWVIEFSYNQQENTNER